ncbi:glycosyltransferase family A protein [Methanobrevibacter sp. V74]|uniref:glycosyltransferase family 2 protein n=1 Tax=Methanobrevibacter sp. V74 TaxID=3064279 RepID=UPI002737514A|nr:glycosyltransferase family A protein [Methanobrevibacter sp. V74]
MDNIKVSVIVPVYNCSEYISTTLNSIINQNFDNYEIIVIDDGSSDNSLDIIYETLSQTDIPHKIIHQRNSGVSVARNNGMEMARGQYFVFVDGDDYILTTHLSELYKNIDEFSLVQFVKKDQDKTSNPYFYHQEEMSTEEFIKKELMMEMPLKLWQVMYKADIIKNNDLKFTPSVVYGEDTEFALKTLSFGDKK